MSGQVPDDPARQDAPGFDERLGQAQARQQAKQPKARTADHTAMGVGMRLSLELVVATSVGGLLGYAFDWVLATSPWFLIALVLIGAAAGVKNMLRVVNDVATVADDTARDIAHNDDVGSGQGDTRPVERD